MWQVFTRILPTGLRPHSLRVHFDLTPTHVLRAAVLRYWDRAEKSWAVSLVIRRQGCRTGWLQTWFGRRGSSSAPS